MKVPADICELVFSTRTSSHGEMVGLTARGETVILHYDAKERIVSIELLDVNKKSCQKINGEVIP